MSVFIIAEIGINHNGSLEIAKQLIDVAKFSGCNAVKFQKRDIDVIYTKEMLDSPRESPWGSTQRDQKQGIEFGRDEYDEIDSYCTEKGIEWFATAWDINSLIFLDKYNSSHAKVASAMLADDHLLREIARRKKHTFISTGLSELPMIERAVRIFKEEECAFELMHCVGVYPMVPRDANLRCIETLKNTFRCDVGYSGHETGLTISIGAVMLGITSLERHITLDRAMYGSDQAASIEPQGLMRLCRDVRLLEIAMGDGIKKVTNDEVAVAKKLRAHITNTMA